MKVFWTLIINNIRISIAKKPLSFIIMTILPIIVLVASSTFIDYSSSYIIVGITDEDNSYMSKVVVDILENVDGIKTYRIGRDEIEPKFRDNTINISVVLSKGFDEGLQKGEITGIKVHSNEGSNDHMLISSLLKNHMLNFRNLGRVSSSDSDQFYESVDKYINNTSIVKKEGINDLYADYNNSNLFIGFLIMLIFFKASSVANTINVDRENNVYTRIFISNTKTWQYYGANVVCNVAISMVQILVAVFAMEYLVDVSIGIKPFDLFCILSIISTVAVAFGTLCVALTKDVDAASMISNLCILVFVLLGGSFIEVEYFPALINKLSYISPVRWAISCVLSLQGGASINDIFGRIAVMAAMTAIFLGIAFYATDKRDKNFVSLKN